MGLFQERNIVVLIIKEFVEKGLETILDISNHKTQNVNVWEREGERLSEGAALLQ